MIGWRSTGLPQGAIDSIRGSSLLSVNSLSKTFVVRRGRERHTVVAVDDLSLEVAAGEIVGFLGPNGAGKTTSMRILTTLLKPTAGSARVAGHDIAREAREVRRIIGYVSQQGGGSSSARVGEELASRAELHGIDKRTATARSRDLLDRFGLTQTWDRPIRSLSGGQRRRLDLAMGLVHEPQLLFLDEPTTGLDPQSRADLWDHIRSLREAQGLTVFLTTHYLDEADRLSDRIDVIDGGRIIASGSPGDLKRRHGRARISADVPNAAERDAAAALFERVFSGVAQVSGPRMSLVFDSSGPAVARLLGELDARNIAYRNLEVSGPTLDDVFLDLTGRSLRDTATS